jgi:3-hydroxymyristoyl/3-hydroxydecanoyl-(acyl carrier protein) dehydratase
VSTLKLTLAADHPSARGHFPGNAIIPGAVLLSTTLSAISAVVGRDFAVCSLSSAKFASPARPGDCVDVEYAVSGIRLILTCSVNKRTVLKAELTRCADGE